MVEAVLKVDAACIARGHLSITAFESDREGDSLRLRLGQKFCDEDNLFRDSKVNAVDLMNRIPVERGTIRTLTRRGRKARIDRTSWALKRAADNVIDPLRVGNNCRENECAVFGECCSVT